MLMKFVVAGFIFVYFRLFVNSELIVNNRAVEEQPLLTASVPNAHPSISSLPKFSLPPKHTHRGKKIARRAFGEDGNSAGVGDYVMSGLGASTQTDLAAVSGTIKLNSLNASAISTKTSTSSTSTPTLSPSNAVPTASSFVAVSANATFNASGSQKSGVVSTSAESANPVITDTVKPVAVVSNTTSHHVTAIPSVRHSHFLGNGTGNATDMGACWDQWQTYWSLNDTRDTPTGLKTATSTSLSSTILTTTVSDGYDSGTAAGTYTTTNIYTQTNGVGGFQINTVTSTLIQTYTISSGDYTGWTETDTTTSTSTMLFYSSAPSGLTMPGCTLPASVPQCQSQWENYTAAQAKTSDPFALTPQCTQASINPSQCTKLRSAYMSEWQGGIASSFNWAYNPVTVGQAETEVTSVNGSATVFGVSTFWPTKSTLFPGCTVGCMSCAITGGKVRLIYWPEATAAPNATATLGTHGPASGIARNVTSGAGIPADETGVRFAVGLGTTFTYPTVYISYSQLYASDSCSGIGSTLYNTIIPIPNSADLSTLWATEEAYANGDYVTASFNYTDLNEPVPNSIYDRQPRCVAYSNQFKTWQMHDGPMTMATDCPRTLPYEPILVVPESILASINPEWASCSGDQRGVYDPPYSLTSYSIAAAPVATTSVSAEPVSASPIKSATPTTPTPTQAPTNTAPASLLIGILHRSQPASSSVDPGTQQQPSPSQQAPSASLPSASDPAGGILSIIGGSGSSSVDPGTQPLASTSTEAPAVVADTQASATPTGTSAPPANAGSAQQPASPQSPSAAAPVSQVAADPATHAADPATGASVSQPAANPAPVHTVVGGATISADPSNEGGVVINSQTLKPGVQTTINNTPVSVGVSSVAVGGSSTVNIASAPQVVGGQTIAAAPSSSGIVVAGQTLQPGALTTIDSTPVSVGQQGSIIVGLSSMVNVAPGSSAQVVGGQTVAADPSNPGGVVVGGQTLQPGVQTTIDNIPVAVGQSGAVALGSSSTVNVVSAPQILGGQTISADPANSDGVVVAGQTLQPGEQTTINNTPISVGSQGSVAVGGSQTVNVAPAPVPAATTIGSEAVSADPFQPGAIVVGGSKTLQPGQVTTIANTPISVGAGGVVVGGTNGASQTVALQPAQSSQEVAVATIGGQAYTATSGQPVVVGSSTLSLGGAPATISGQVVSLGSSGLVVGSNTAPYSAALAPTGGSGIAVTLGGNIYTAASGGSLNLGSTTIFAGGAAATVGGQRVSLGSNGLVVGSSTIAYSSGPASALPQAAVTIGSSTLNAVSSSGNVVFGSVTLHPGGPALTTAGETISAAPSGSGIVIDGTTHAFSTPAVIDGITAASEASFTAGGHPFTALAVAGNPSEIAIPEAGATLTVGGPAATISGETVSAGSSGLVIDGSSTIPYAAVTPTNGALEVEAPFTVGGSSFTAFEVESHPGEIFIPGASLTLSVGGPDATISGETISAATGGLVVDGTTEGWETLTAATRPTLGGGETLGPWSRSGSGSGSAGITGVPTASSPGESPGSSSSGRREKAQGWALLLPLVVAAISRAYFSYR
ncbi:MAG: hypothetical protein M1820_004431 [Bogoriella megaspora]|nr:MAG: hypothetical protein M1820_004431 [Bogoriella megaspora]